MVALALSVTRRLFNIHSLTLLQNVESALNINVGQERSKNVHLALLPFHQFPKRHVDVLVQYPIKGKKQKKI